MENTFIFTIVFTEKCNLACEYCYVPHEAGIISEEVLLAVIELTKQRIDNGIKVQLDIFGGEPLLIEDRVRFFIDQIAPLDERYKSKIIVTVFTNATLLTEDFARYTSQYDFVRYNFSVDGCKACHDAARIYPDGNGSYDDVINGINNYAKAYNIPPNNIGGKFLISPYNLKYVMQSCRENLEKGRGFLSAGLDRDAVWTDEDVEEYRKVIYELADFYIQNLGKMERIELFVISLLDYEYSSQTYCSAGKSQLGIAPNGDIYPCQRFYNNRSPFKLGNVFDGLGGKWYQMFQAYNARCFRACHRCDTFHKFNCLGQCLGAAYENGDIFECIPNVCKILKITYQAAKYVDDTLKDNPKYKEAIEKAKKSFG